MISELINSAVIGIPSKQRTGVSLSEDIFALDSANNSFFIWASLFCSTTKTRS